jgi:tetratricopeptide (TPR) repeat protein
LVAWRQVVEDALAGAVTAGNPERLFERGTLEAALGLAGQVERRRLGRSRPDPDALSVLVQLHLLRASARPQAGSDEMVSAVALSALMTGAAEQIPEPVRQAAQAVAGRMGAELRQVPVEALAVAAVVAAGTNQSLRQVVDVGTGKASARAALYRLIGSAEQELPNGYRDRDQSEQRPPTLAVEPDPRARTDAQRGLELLERFDRTGRLKDLTQGIELVRAALRQPADPDWIARNQGNLATALTRLHQSTGAAEALDESIELFRAAVACPGLTPPERTFWLADLAQALRIRFVSDRDPADLDALVETAQATLDTGFVPDRNALAAWRSELASAIGQRLALQPDGAQARADADRQVELARDVIYQAPRDYPDWAGLWSNLGNALTARAQVAQAAGRTAAATVDANEAVEHHRTAVRRMPPDHPYGFRIVSNLSRALMLSVQLGGDRSQLHDAVGAARDAVRLAGSDPEVLPAAWTAYLQTALEAAAGTDDPAILTRVIEAATQAAAEPGFGIPAWLTGSLTGTALRDRHLLTGDPADLDRAVEEFRTALRLTPATEADARFQARLGLGTALRTRFQARERPADLAEAIDVVQAAAGEAIEPGARADVFGLLGTCVQLDGAARGDLAQLGRGIALAREAIALAPPGPDGDGVRLVVQADLSVGLRMRYEETRDRADLDEAIELARAVAAAPSRAPVPGRAAGAHATDRFRVGVGLQLRYRHQGREEDLDEAIEECRAAVRIAPPGDPDRAGYLSSLGLALQLRYGARHRPADLDEAVEAGHAALATTPPGSAVYSARLSNVALAHRIRAELTGDRPDLDTAVRLGRESVADPGAGAVLLANTLVNLSRALAVRAALTGASEDAAEAEQVRRRVAGLSSAPRQTRINAAVAWAMDAAAREDWPAAADGYSAAVDLIELVVWHGLDRATREERLAALPGLAAEAAASALAAGDPERALGLLERGRSVLWSQHLHLRDDLDEVRDADPELYRQLTELAAELEDPAGEPVPEPLGGPGSRVAGERRQQLAQRWDQALAAVRARPGLAGVLRPDPARELLDVAAAGPVVVLNVSRYRCDALLVTGTGIAVLPLPGLTVETVAARAAAHLSALEDIGAEDDLAADQAEQLLDSGLAWLAGQVVDPVLDELNRLGALPSAPGAAPRVWWCPTGLLTLLPLHAAALDRVTSSYTATLRSLRAARTAVPAGDDAKLLVVAVPEPAERSGLPAVPGAVAEADRLAARFPARAVLRIGESATQERVLADLPGHPYAHFACHGGQDRQDPSRAALQLYDGPLPVLALAGLRLTGELAFLSACESAAGGVTLADEAIHLAGAVQVAGYRQVVATLWPITDELAPELADAVYAGLQAGDRIEAARTAGALHEAVRALRARLPDRPSLWASYAHFGC